MRRIGFLINPIAGMGGSVGLKGTDGMEEEARRRGAMSVAPKRALAFGHLLKTKDRFLTCGEPMGYKVLKECGISATSVYCPKKPTTAQDTQGAARVLVKTGIDILIFVGGDGTARDILEAIGQQVPVLGVPAGVKMYSGVFAYTPRHAAEVVNNLLDNYQVEEREVVDIDEDKFRQDELGVSIKGYLLSPANDNLQCSKGFESGGIAAKQAIAERMVEEMEGGVVYVIGGGSTTRALKDALKIRGSLLGIDVVKDGEILCEDAAADGIQQVLGERNAIIVSPLGGHGFLFGRGNEQITYDLIEQVGVVNIIVIAVPEKLARLEALRVDTGSEDIDNQLRGFIRVITGHSASKLMHVR